MLTLTTHLQDETRCKVLITRRLLSILRRQLKRSRGTGRNYLDHKRWPNAFFARHGLFTMKEARV